MALDVDWSNWGVDPNDRFEPNCDAVNPDTDTCCDRNWHADDLHWHDPEEGDPLPLLWIEWRAEVVPDDGRDSWDDPVCLGPDEPPPF